MAFITRDTNRLKLSGSDWRASGVNASSLALRQAQWGAVPNTSAALNLYYPSQAEIDSVFAQATAIGANYVRTLPSAFSVGATKSLFPDGVNINETAAVQFDLMVSRAAAAGQRLWIPFVDPHGYFYGSTATWGANFFTDAATITKFKAAITVLLSRDSTITGLTPAEDDTIFCWGLGSEINAADAWVTELAAHVKSLAPNQLVADGRELVAVSANSLSDANVDIVGNHAYPLSSANIATYSGTVGGAKVVIWSEYDMHRIQGGSTLAAWQAAAEADWPATWSTAPWSLCPHRDDHGVADYTNSNGKNTFLPGYESLPYLTHARTAWIATRNHHYAMRGIAVPAAETCPAPVAAATGNQKLKWKGSTGADTYTVQISDTGGGGWTEETTGKKDSETPLAVSGAKFRRVIPVNIDGSDGTASNAVYTGGDLTGLTELSLAGYWLLNESSGNAIDSADGNDLTENSGAIGSSESARDFEAGDTEYFWASDNADLSVADIDFSIQACVKHESVAAHQFIVAKWAAGQKSYVLWYNQTANRYSFGVSSDGTLEAFVTADTFGAVSAGVWNIVHAGHRATGNVIWIRVNGGAENTAAHTTGAFNGTAPFSIGANLDGGSPSIPVDGLVRRVGLWKRDIAADVAALVAAEGVVTFETWPEPASGGGGSSHSRMMRLLRP